jgi:hypothetical protein
MTSYLIEPLRLSGYSFVIYQDRSGLTLLGRGEIRVQFWHASNSSATQVVRSGRVTVRQAPPEAEFAA